MARGLSKDLLCVAEGLINTNGGEPQQVHLRRAVSSVYYALFHYLAEICADSFIGASDVERKSEAWRQVYRSLEHGLAKKACGAASGINFPTAIKNYAALFGTYQDKRHKADYDPFISFSKKDVADMIGEVQQTLEDFERVDIKHRKTFSAFVLLKKR